MEVVDVRNENFLLNIVVNRIVVERGVLGRDEIILDVKVCLNNLEVVLSGFFDKGCFVDGKEEFLNM